METIVIALLCVSALLFIFSFFQKDQTKQLEKDLEDLSITVLKEHYQLKKRLSVIEEELFIERFGMGKSAAEPEVNDILRNQVLALHNQGVDLNQISNQSSLPLHIVKEIIAAR